MKCFRIITSNPAFITVCKQLVMNQIEVWLCFITFYISFFLSFPFSYLLYGRKTKYHNVRFFCSHFLFSFFRVVKLCCCTSGLLINRLHVQTLHLWRFSYHCCALDQGTYPQLAPGGLSLIVKSCHPRSWWEKDRILFSFCWTGQNWDLYGYERTKCFGELDTVLQSHEN